MTPSSMFEHPLAGLPLSRALLPPPFRLRCRIPLLLTNVISRSARAVCCIPINDEAVATSSASHMSSVSSPYRSILPPRDTLDAIFTAGVTAAKHSCLCRIARNNALLLFCCVRHPVSLIVSFDVDMSSTLQTLSDSSSIFKCPSKSWGMSLPRCRCQNHPFDSEPQRFHASGVPKSPASRSVELSSARPRCSRR